MFDDSPTDLKKWALNPSRPGALSGWKLSTTFSISSAVTCRINPSYWSSVSTLKNLKLLFTLQDLICLKMFWKWETAAALMPFSPLTMWPLSSLMERKVFRALLSDKAAHIVLVFLSPFFNHRTRNFCLIRDPSASSIALSSYSFRVSSIAACSTVRRKEGWLDCALINL